jgi:hypothetical protein
VVVRAFEPTHHGWCCSRLSFSSFKGPGRAGFFVREMKTSFGPEFFLTL